MTTVEGILRRTVTGLEQDQPVRRIMAPDDAEKIDAYVKRIEDLLSLCQPFHIVSSSFCYVRADPGPLKNIFL